MQNVYDTALTSSDLSLDRVLGTGLPVALLFYDHDLPANFRQTLDDLARRYAGRALIVLLPSDDASQAMSRFNVRQLPALVTLRDGKPVTNQGSIAHTDLAMHLGYLLGEGPMPVSRGQAPGADGKRAPAGSPVPVAGADFDREVLWADRPVLVDFWAPWCAPCRMVAPALEAIARDHAGSLKVAKVNVDDNPELASKYRTMSIPTMIVFTNGREVDRWVGALPEGAIRTRVARWIR